MKLRKICQDCVGKKDCLPANEDNWRDCRGKSYLKSNPKLFNKLKKNSKEVQSKIIPPTKVGGF